MMEAVVQGDYQAMSVSVNKRFGPADGKPKADRD